MNAIPGHERFAAGAIAGVTAQFSIFPLEVVKVNPLYILSINFFYPLLLLFVNCFGVVF